MRPWVAVMAMAVACGSSSSGEGASPGDLRGESFQSIAIESSDLQSTSVDPTGVTLTFDDDSVSWVAACNHMGADVEFGEHRLNVADAVDTTDMGCSKDAHGQDDWLSDFFTGDPGWTLDDNRLTLEGDSARITFER